MEKKVQITTDNAPRPIGPYSQGIAVKKPSELLFVSGQIPLHPVTGELVGAGVEAQTIQVMENIQAVLERGGHSWADVCSARIYLADLADFSKVNAIYATFQGDPAPARAAFQVCALPKGALVEIEVVSCR